MFPVNATWQRAELNRGVAGDLRSVQLNPVVLVNGHLLGL